MLRSQLFIACIIFGVFSIEVYAVPYSVPSSKIAVTSHSQDWIPLDDNEMRQTQGQAPSELEFLMIPIGIATAYIVGAAAIALGGRHLYKSMLQKSPSPTKTQVPIRFPRRSH